MILNDKRNNSKNNDNQALVSPPAEFPTIVCKILSLELHALFGVSFCNLFDDYIMMMMDDDIMMMVMMIS